MAWAAPRPCRLLQSSSAKSALQSLQPGWACGEHACKAQKLQLPQSRPPRQCCRASTRRLAISSLSCTALALSAAAVPSFEILRVPGDGSCLFRALAQGRHVLEHGMPLGRGGLLREGYQLRQDVCEAMLARKAEIEPFIVGRFDTYVDNMLREGSWGGEPELAVAADVVRRPVLVYKLVQSGLFGSDLEKITEYAADKYRAAAPVCLLYSGNHYDLLLVSK